VVLAQRKAKAWLAKAHDDLERVRDCTGLHLLEVTETSRHGDMELPCIWQRGRAGVAFRATKKRHVPATRITHQAVMQLGLLQKVTGAYQEQLRRGPNGLRLWNA
jgi:hypothetical protein